MKKFNDTGLCVPSKHYMVDISEKMKTVHQFIAGGEYFAINRPRQYGKTTTLNLISNHYANSREYMLIQLSFEGVGDDIFKEEKRFCNDFIKLLKDEIVESDTPIAEYINGFIGLMTGFQDMSLLIKNIVLQSAKKIILMIDEVDKASNNQLFVNFIGMLRDKYLKSSTGKDHTFHSVILAGVHDIKTLKLKLRSDQEAKLNSPWNIAADFEVDMSFNAAEISTMLLDYSQEKNIEMDISAISKKIWYYTSGYPFLVSKLCKTIDEKILPETQQTHWTLNDVETAFKMLTNKGYTTTLFDDIVKNLENNRSLYQIISNIVIEGKKVEFDLENVHINLAVIYGIVLNINGLCKIHNRIFEQRMYKYFMSYIQMNSETELATYDNYVVNKVLNLKYTLQRFQQFIKENHSQRDTHFLEREGRLLFLSFIRPIINGKGFDFKEPVVGDDRRMDIVITFNEMRYVVELKIWRGEEYHQQGIQQLSDYLDIYNLKEGFLLIYDFRKEKQYKEQTIQFADKQIFTVWV